MDKVRIDKWLWAARFYKTRQIAIDAINAGHVQINGQRVKPSRQVSQGDEIRVRKQNVDYEIKVDVLSDKRGPASIAQTLYTETDESIERRKRYQEQRKLSATGQGPNKRPDKRARGKIIRFQRQD